MKRNLGSPAASRIVAEAAEAMREAIRQAGGREVLFAGPVDSDGKVARVRVWARGNEGAVPPVFEGLAKGDVVIHNHPSGDVSPSDADLGLAAIYGFHGHGVYIVDNSVERVYVVVEPLLERDRVRLDASALTQAIARGSKLARAIPSYEERPQQVEMMRHVARAFNEDGICVIEAPTGVGKTMAYLVPAVRWALENRERIVVSTKTINLQEQLVLKDIPVLQKCTEKPFQAVLVKGRGNYLCWRKLERALSEATLFRDETEQEKLQTIAEWARTTEDGSLSDLPFVPGRDLWSSVCCEADTCRLSNCPNPKQCFLGKARRDLARADVLVVNHHMLFSDLAVKKEMDSFAAPAVLPAYKRVIFDEAHSIEDSATEYFGVEVTRLGALSLLGRFVRSERGQERGLLPYLKVKLTKSKDGPATKELERILDVIDNRLMPGIAAAREALIAMFEALRHLTAERCGQIGREIKWRLTRELLADEALREVHAVYVLPAVEEIRTCSNAAGTLMKRLKDALPTDNADRAFMSELQELEAYSVRLERLGSALAQCTSEKLERNTVRWIEIDSGNKNIVRLVQCPLEVGEPMADWVYANVRTVVMTSATLSVGRRFDFFFSRIGLDRVAEREPEAVALDSPFDYARQALLCIPTDIEAPDSPSFHDQTVACIREIIEITKGHALALFTSFYALDYAHKRLADDFRRMGIALLKQGEAARTRLLDRFRKDASSVLFATDSFWEGVDVPGEALQCVILPKLPFRVPTEPILEARAEAIEEDGGNAFMEYSVPQAVIKFKQGLGRLIRRKTDRGAIVLLDKRVVEKRYGRLFLESLPPMKVVRGPRSGVMLALTKFFAGNNV